MKKQSVKTPWNINELETYFKNAVLPPPPIKLNPVCVIVNVRGFIDSHIDILKTHEGKETFITYLHRLHQLKELIEKQKMIIE